MRKKEHIARYSAEEIAAKIGAGEDQTDWNRVRAMSQGDVERLADEEDGLLAEDWEASIAPGLPARKHPIFRRDVRLRLDADVLDWFRAQGRDYQLQINEVLRAFVEAQKRSKPAARTTE
jgi:uncharacterized protein (DUF4415 family)